MNSAEIAHIKNTIATDNHNTTMMVKDLQDEIKKIREECKQDVDRRLQEANRDAPMSTSPLQSAASDAPTEAPREQRTVAGVGALGPNATAAEIEIRVQQAFAHAQVRPETILIEARDDESTNEKVPGTKARLQGLKAKPELNGQEGTLLSFDKIKGRWQTLLSSGISVQVKPENLEVNDVIQSCGSEQ